MKTKIFSLLIIFLMISLSCQQMAMDRVKVEGNRFVDLQGNTLIFKGFSISDPDKLVKDDRWNIEYFQEARAWGANIIRIPVHPRAWRERGQEGYLELLDQAVEWAKALNIYLIIDWHSIGNLRTEKYFDPMYFTTKKETYEFWSVISKKYTNEPVVAFYELFNEPTTYNDQYGSLTWDQWKAIVTEMITIVKANNPSAIPLVAGFNWGYDLSVMKDDMINLEGIAYVSHPYPQKREQPWEPKWEEDWGFMAERAPLILTEWGFAMTEEEGFHVPVKGDVDYGQRLTQYAKSKGISWVMWVFDPDWEPMMFYDWDYTPTRQGKFFKQILDEERN